jgi:TRAP-type C4-dicarboxylate transport system permease small subunit
MDRSIHPEDVAAVPRLARLTARLDRFVCWVCVALFVAILIIMVLQVTFRYVLATPLIWTEELARYLYVWACWLGAPVALRRGNHISIAVVSDRLSPRLGRAAALGTQALALVFLAQLTLQGTILTVKSHTLDAITLPIPWSVIYVAAPISAVLMMLETVRAMWLGPVGSADAEVQG